MPQGGARANSGRKTIAAELLNAEIRTTGTEDARYAYSLFVQKMHGERISPSRLMAAKEVMDRVLGKPKQVLAGMPTEPIAVVYTSAIDYRICYKYADPDAPKIEARSTGDSPPSSEVQVAGDGPEMGKVIFRG